ncbi:MAG: hypothetical protein OXN17_12815 [Candidatus Poribacteria bacterium]|nr:hypothetical protein [Candidatus Poribacteria bacterium]MDE0502601.1 hypothetical protein [Candidatus Poribacteria bacterium]
MSFFKQHWQFTVPAIVVVCALLLGVLALYSTSQPKKPKTVYVMPERSADDPPTPNAGSVSLSPTPQPTTSVQPGVSSTPNDTPESFSTTDEDLNVCCPEEANDSSAFYGIAPDSTQSHSNMMTLSPEMIADAEDYRRYWDSLDRYFEKHDELRVEGKALRTELASMVSLVTSDWDALSPEQKKELHERAALFLSNRADLTTKQETLKKEYPTRPPVRHSR